MLASASCQIACCRLPGNSLSIAWVLVERQACSTDRLQMQWLPDILFARVIRGCPAGRFLPDSMLPPDAPPRAPGSSWGCSAMVCLSSVTSGGAAYLHGLICFRQHQRNREHAAGGSCSVFSLVARPERLNSFNIARKGVVAAPAGLYADAPPAALLTRSGPSKLEAAAAEVV